MPEDDFIHFANLSKTYLEGETRRIVLSSASGSFCQGEFTAILGRSGTGKSTLLNLLSGIDEPDEGQIWIDGQRLLALSDFERTILRRNHIGFVFQFFNLIPTLTVWENVCLPLDLIQSVKSGSDYYANAEELLDSVGLLHRRQAYPDRLSGGEQQRVALARALVHDPKLVLADEPTGNLDDESGEAVLDLLDQLTRKADKNLILVTHSRRAAQRADRILVLSEGNLNLLPSLNLLRTGWRYLIRHPWQSGLMIFGIALGVAVVVAIDLANASARRAFDLSIDSVAGRATHQVTAAPLDLDDQIYIDLRAAFPEIPMAPVISDYAASPELGGILIQILGIDPYAESPFRNYINLSSQEVELPNLAEFLTRPGAVIISANLAERYGFSDCPGIAAGGGNCDVTLNIGGLSHNGQITGLMTPADNISADAVETLALMDISSAQELTGRLGKLSNIDLLITDDAQDYLSLIEGELPKGVRLEAIEARSGALFQITSAFRLNLTALSLLALIVGLFLIYNTMTVSTLRRRPLYGLLRCLGVTRTEVYSMVLAEAVVVGLVGSTLGILLGILLGRESVRLVSQTINDLYFVVNVQTTTIPVSSLVKGAVLGVVTTILAAALPAREAASVPPRAALIRSGLETKSQNTVRLAAVVGILSTLLGIVVLWLPDSTLVLSFTGTFLIIIGFASMTPAVTVGLMRMIETPLGRLASFLGRMAPRNVVASISRTSIATAALMVAVSVSIGLSLMVESFRFTVVDWLGQTLSGDIYISSPGVTAAQTSTTIVPEVFAILEDWPGIEKISTIRVVQADSPDGPIQLGAVNNADEVVQRPLLTGIGEPDEIEAAFRTGSLLVSEPLARRLDLSPETSGLTLSTPNGLASFPIAGVYYDYGNTQGVALIDKDIYTQNWNDSAVTAVSLNVEDGADTIILTRNLQDRLNKVQQLEVQPNQSLRENALAIFDRTFQITTSLQALVTLVAFTGILSALLSLQLEKGRELSILSAIGLTKRQLSGLVFLESGLMGGIAGILAMPTGFVLSLILIYIINRRAFGWTLQLEITAVPFIQAFVFAILAALIAAIYPAWRISRINPVEGLRSEEL